MGIWRTIKFTEKTYCKCKRREWECAEEEEREKRKRERRGRGRRRRIGGRRTKRSTKWREWRWRFYSFKAFSNQTFSIFKCFALQRFYLLASWAYTIQYKIALTHTHTHADETKNGQTVLNKIKLKMSQIQWLQMHEKYHFELKAFIRLKWNQLFIRKIGLRFLDTCALLMCISIT